MNQNGPSAGAGGLFLLKKYWNRVEKYVRILY